MLIPRAMLDRIGGGEVTLAFRRWVKPTVKTGGTLKTAIGVLDVVRVEEAAAESITEADAVSAGAPSLAVLLGELERRTGTLYRIELAYREPDPRIALREEDSLSDEESRGLAKRLQGMDQRAAGGAWTRQVLAAIERHPMQAAGDLATQLGFEKEWLKTHIRKLKNLGLTVSHHPGYTLSPRGRTVLERLGR